MSFAERGIGINEPFCIVAIAIEVEIHGQKGHFSSHIPIAEAFVEFDAVKDGDFLIDDDMLQMEVTMTIANPVVGNPGTE